MKSSKRQIRKQQKLIELRELLETKDHGDSTKTFYENISVLDLRHMNDPEAVKTIGGIENVSQVIITKPDTSELQQAWAGVAMENISLILYVDKDDEMLSYNGKTKLDLSGFEDDKSYLLSVNGVSIIYGCPIGDAKIKLNIKGSSIVEEKVFKNSNIIVESNGKIYNKPFDHVIDIKDNIFTVSHIDNLEKNSLLLCKNNKVMKIDKGVTEEMLKNKNVTFIFKRKGYKCSKNLRGYMSVFSEVK